MGDGQSKAKKQAEERVERIMTVRTTESADIMAIRKAGQKQIATTALRIKHTNDQLAELDREIAGAVAANDRGAATAALNQRAMLKQSLSDDRTGTRLMNASLFALQRAMTTQERVGSLAAVNKARQAVLALLSPDDVTDILDTMEDLGQQEDELQAALTAGAEGLMHGEKDASVEEEFEALRAAHVTGTLVSPPAIPTHLPGPARAHATPAQPVAPSHVVAPVPVGPPPVPMQPVAPPVPMVARVESHSGGGGTVRVLLGTCSACRRRR